MNALLLPLLFLLALTLGLALYVAAVSRHKKASQEPLSLAGRVGSVESPLAPEGFVLIDGELWRARARGGVEVGRGRSNVRVVGASGCLLEVEPLA
jgi:membrane-bound serine protease (ClpP class)